MREKFRPIFTGIVELFSVEEIAKPLHAAPPPCPPAIRIEGTLRPKQAGPREELGLHMW